MEHEPGVARIASLLADPARMRMLWCLLDGTMRPAGELAYVASISAPSATAHLAKLVDGGLLAAQAQGRHRYFRIAGPAVATAIEGLASLSVTVRPGGVRSLPPPARVSSAFLHCRTCYDHLAGETAVSVLESMLKSRWLAAEGENFRVTRVGEKKLAALGVDLYAARRSKRVFARACVDLTQRRPHLGGALGAALLDLYVAQRWILRSRRTRAVSITPKGREAFKLQ